MLFSDFPESGFLSESINDCENFEIQEGLGLDDRKFAKLLLRKDFFRPMGL